MISNVKKVIQSYIAQDTKLTTIWENQSAPRPKTLYVSLNIIAGPTKTGFDDIRRDSDTQFSVEGQRLLTLSVNMWGTGAMEKMVTFRDGLERPSTTEFLNARGIALVRYENIIDLTALRETAFEERAQMDVVIRATAVTKDTTGYIDKVGLETTLIK